MGWAPVDPCPNGEETAVKTVEVLTASEKWRVSQRIQWLQNCHDPRNLIPDTCTTMFYVQVHNSDSCPG